MYLGQIKKINHTKKTVKIMILIDISGHTLTHTNNKLRM
jgi:hypothetical protein